MVPSRNSILIVGLTLFLVWYISSWAYQTLYIEPRQRLGNEIEKLSGEIATGRNNLTMMTQFFSQTSGFYVRSLPQIPNDARSLYSFWLLELLQYSGFEDNHVVDNSPSRLQFSRDYRFSIQCTGSLSQLSRFLFEFYYAPFLHRITTMTLTPIEGNTEQLSFSITINALGLYPRQANDPYPLMNQIPTGWISRLVSNDLTSYQTIADRNLLQTAKGGIDRADYVFLTGTPKIGEQKEAWFTIRTDNSGIRTKVGDPIHIGSFLGKVVEILDQDIVLDRNGERWLLTIGECLNEAFALPPETAEKSD